MSLVLTSKGGRAHISHWYIIESLASRPAQLSLPGINVSAWHLVQEPACTVIAGLLGHRGFDEPSLFYSDNLSKVPKKLFRVPWLYRQEFRLLPLAPDQHVHLILRGVTSKADVFINGHCITDRSSITGTYVCTWLNITRSVQEGINGLVIQAHPTDYRRDLAGGWSDVCPSPPDSGMGVWRPVDMKTTGPVALSTPRVTTDYASGQPDKVVVTISITLMACGRVPKGFVCIRGFITQPITPMMMFFSSRVNIKRGDVSRVSVKLEIADPEIWWPVGWGDRPLYELKMGVFSDSGECSDQATPRRFGIRAVTSKLNSHGDRQFAVNGIPFQVRGAAYFSDIFLRRDLGRIMKILLHAQSMGMNTIRLKGKLEDLLLYTLADNLGLMVLAGWGGCDKWEAWDHNEEAPGTRWTDHDYQVAEKSLLGEAEVMQSHPCMLGFLLGSDYPPDEAATRCYMSALRHMDWPNPVIASASMRGHPKDLGPSGMKMQGPYTWVPPYYWYGNSAGAAFGFASEVCAGAGTPEASSLRRFLSLAEAHQMWKNPMAGQFHQGPEASVFHDRGIYNHALANRYGRPDSLKDYVLKTQLMDYEAVRAQLEAFAARQSAQRPATGMIYWVLNSPWPSLHWQLIDYYLHPTAAYFAAKQALRAEHVVLDYEANSIYLVNHSGQAGFRQIKAHLIDRMGATFEYLFKEVQTFPRTSFEVMTISKIAEANTITFLYLELADESGMVLDRNVYWLPAKRDVLDWNRSNWYTTPVASYASFSGLMTMPRAEVEATVSRGKDPATAIPIIIIRLDNQASVPAFFIRLFFLGLNEDKFMGWSDNYLTLFARESQPINVFHPQGDAGRWLICMEGVNVQQQTIARSESL